MMSGWQANTATYITQTGKRQSGIQTYIHQGRHTGRPPLADATQTRACIHTKHILSYIHTRRLTVRYDAHNIFAYKQTVRHMHLYYHAYMQSSMHSYRQAYTHIYICRHACMHIHTHTYIHTYIHTHINTKAHTVREAYMQAYTHIPIHAYMHTNIHAVRRLHKHIHTTQT